MKMIAETNLDDIGRAKAGRQEATFRRLVEEHQRELHAHCYRMLGSVHDADDAVQDTLLRAWRALPNFRGESSLRTWLYRIATNVCLDAVARRPKRVLPVDYGPPTSPGNGGPVRALPESVWIEPYPDEALAVEDGAVGPEARMKGARRWSLRSFPRCSTFPLVSGPCFCSATCSDSRPRKPRRRSRPRR
jgi:RNA polymerase sigma-70 factor, ECF subfamily